MVTASTMRKILYFADVIRAAALAPEDAGFDRTDGMDVLAEFGFEGEFVGYFRAPWNPLAGLHAVWRALDPARAVWAMVKRRDAAAIVSSAESGALVPLLLRRLMPCPILVLHDSDHQGWRPRRWIQRLVLPRADLVLTQTEAQARYLVAEYRLRRAPVFVGPQIDDRFFRPGAAGPGDYVLAVGNDAARDFAGLIAAAAPIGIRLRLLTRLPVVIPDSAKARIEIISHRVSHAGLRTLYEGARFVALPLRERKSPGGMTALLEAMAMGKAVVMTNSSGVIEFVEPDVTGLCVPIGDMEAMARALRALWDDPARCVTMGEAARRRLDAHFSTRRYAERLAAAVRSLRSNHDD